MRSATVVFVGLVLTFALTLSAFGFDYEIVDGHPRLFFVAQDLPKLRAKCNGPLANEYQKLKSYCDAHMGDALPTRGITTERQLAAFSFVWLMTNDARYAARAKQIAQSVVSAGSTRNDNWVRGGSLFFDWCYNYLTPSERNVFGNAIADGGDWWMGQQNWYGVGNYHPKHGWLREFAYSGLAIYDEGIDDTMAKALCDTFWLHNFGDRHTLCCYDEIAGDGSYFEGEYNRNRLYEQHREGLALWEVAGTPKPYTVSGNFRNLGKYYMYDMGAKISAGSFLGSKQGDDHNHSFGARNARTVLYDVAGRIQGGVEQWVADEIGRLGMGSLLDEENWKFIVYKDTDLAPVPPTNMPFAWCFRDMGTAYMRSGWDYSAQSEDVYAVFRCERYPRGHTHAHQNHLMIARGPDLLALDSGDYDSTLTGHHRNYFERTIAHNTITVYDPNDTSFGSYENDGGQITADGYAMTRYCGESSTPDQFRGIITGFETTDTFAYMKGDATPAYEPYRVQLFTREIVYLYPDLFVVFDRVVAGSATYKKRWLLHSINEPQVSGNTTVVQEADSKLFVRTLLPDPFDIVKIGGPGREFEVNGTNYRPSGGWDHDAGEWRFEVSPATNANEHLFLHVLYVCDDGVTSMPATRLVDTGNMIGVEVAGHVVLFSSTGASIDSVTYEFGD